MKKVGLIILAAGLLLTILSGYDLMMKEKILDIGNLEIVSNKRYSFNWSPLLGIAVMAVGASIALFGKKGNLKVVK